MNGLILFRSVTVSIWFVSRGVLVESCLNSFVSHYAKEVRKTEVDRSQYIGQQCEVYLVSCRFEVAYKQASSYMAISQFMVHNNIQSTDCFNGQNK
jgi:hypothetical protein